jgi:hypothetical protein
MSTMSEIRDFGDGLPQEQEKAKTLSFVVWLLMLLPLGLTVGTIWGLTLYLNREKDLSHKASTPIRVEEIQQILNNYASFFGDRGFSSEEEIKAMSMVANNIVGELQANNSLLLEGSDLASYEAAGLSWRSLWGDIPGSKRSQVFFVVTSYDGKRSLANAAKIAVPLTVGKSLAAVEIDFTLRFLFLPKQASLDEQEAWIRKHCMKDHETAVGMFFLGHLSNQEAGKIMQEGSWKATDGDLNWASEILKGSRAMHFGKVNLHHAVLYADREFTGGEAREVENAAKGLREILFMVTGADR